MRSTFSSLTVMGGVSLVPRLRLSCCRLHMTFALPSTTRVSTVAPPQMVINSLSRPGVVAVDSACGCCEMFARARDPSATWSLTCSGAGRGGAGLCPPSHIVLRRGYVHIYAEQWPWTGSRRIWDWLKASTLACERAGVRTAPMCAGVGGTVVEMAVRFDH